MLRFNEVSFIFVFIFILFLKILDQETGEIELQGWKFISEGEFFYPSTEHIGYYLCVVVDFGEDFLVKAAVSASSIIDIDEKLIFEDRQKNYCKSRLEETKSV